MRKVNYVFATILNSVGFLIVFGTLMAMHIENGRWQSEVASLENSVRSINLAYNRFINGRTLNSDYSLWKKTDSKYKTYHLKGVDQDSFLRGVAVFQKAFWKKYYNKKNNKKVTSLSWEAGVENVDDDLREKIISRYPVKEELGRRLNFISDSIFNRLNDVRDEYEGLKYNLYVNYVILAAFLLFNIVFYLRRTDRKDETIINSLKDSEIQFYPTNLLKLEDDQIACYSNALKSITPNIIEYKNWNDYFITNFSVVKNINGEKIVTLRRSKGKRYTLKSSVKDNYRYISFSPLTTVVKENINTVLGKDSLVEVVKESIHRVELLYDRLKINISMENDALIGDGIVHKTDEMISLVGSFYKRLAVLENKTIRIDIKSEVKKNVVKIIFSSKSVRLDPNTMRNITNFNFSFYPQKIESLFSKYDGKVSIKNKYSNNKNFICSELSVTFDLREHSVKVSNDSIRMLEN